MLTPVLSFLALILASTCIWNSFQMYILCSWKWFRKHQVWLLISEIFSDATPFCSHSFDLVLLHFLQLFGDIFLLFVLMPYSPRYTRCITVIFLWCIPIDLTHIQLNWIVLLWHLSSLFLNCSAFCFKKKTVNVYVCCKDLRANAVVVVWKYFISLQQCFLMWKCQNTELWKYVLCLWQ